MSDPVPPTPPQLLVSVRSAEEALVALSGGADWIDLKEPNDGPLAAVDVQVAREVAQSIPSQCTLSAALGELADWDDSLSKNLLTIAEISVVKLGLAGCARFANWQQLWTDIHFHAAKQEKRLAAVIYADWQSTDSPAPTAILDLAESNRCRYLLIDTYDKRAGSTLGLLTSDELEEILARARQAGMTTVLAGSLTKQTLGQIPQGLVDIVAVRGAVCRGSRTDRVEAGLVEDLRQALSTQFCVSTLRS